MDLLDLAACVGGGLLALGGLWLANALTSPPRARMVDAASFILALRRRKAPPRKAPSGKTPPRKP